MNIPSQLIAGDSASWADRPFQDAQGRIFGSTGFALKYVLRGPAVLDLPAVSSGDGWITSLTATQSADLQAGVYSAFAVVSSAAERFTFGPVRLTVKPDPLTAGLGFDGRSMARKALEDAELALSKFKASGGRMRKYKIGTREMEFESSTEILSLISYWRSRVLTEEKAEAAAKGLGDPTNLYVRFK